MNRDELLALGERVWADLMQAAAEVPADRREQQGVVEGWSVHDVVWHVSYWLERSAGVLEQVRPGAPYPEEPEDDAYYDAENDLALPVGRTRSWDDVITLGEEGHARARRVVAACDESVTTWVCDRYLEEVDHIREHAEQIRAFSPR